MYILYSILLTLGFIVLSPWFIFDAIFKGKYAPGFWQRMGFVPSVDAAGRSVIWLHCVSVGETNAARVLVTQLRTTYPDAKLVVSTTTRTGQKLAAQTFAGVVDHVFYFPFDFRRTVRRALSRIRPTAVLLMETEIWFNFIREAGRRNVRIAIVNGRLSPRSFKRFGYIKKFIRRVLSHLDLALMQEKADATRIMSLGLRASKVRVTGNLKFDHDIDERETQMTEYFRDRFGLTPDAPLIIAASTHDREESYVLAAFKEIFKSSSDILPRLMIAPRHPERFSAVADLIKSTGFNWVRRSETESSRDREAEIILLDSIGELRAAYPIAEIVFVGGSLVPHGGQSIFEPGAAGKAIVTGPNTINFAAAVDEFRTQQALIQIRPSNENDIVPQLAKAVGSLLSDDLARDRLGTNALELTNNNRGAVARTLEYLAPLIERPGSRSGHSNYGR